MVRNSRFRFWIMCSAFLLVYFRVPFCAVETVSASEEKVVCAGGTYPGCGPRSLWVGAMRLGIPLSLADLEAACSMTSEGTSLYDLLVGAESSGLQAEAVRLDWNQLIELDTTAVLFVGGNHFVCVDPREERTEEGGEKVRIYDGPRGAKWVDRVELESIWEGEGLLIYAPDDQAEAAEGPRIQFETLLIDFGSLGPAVIQKGFNFRNIGTEPLEITGIKKPCACRGATARLSERLFAPGAEGVVRCSHDLRGKNSGFESQSVTVFTNDPQHRSIQLVLQGFVEKPLLLSRNQFDFGQLIPGENAEQKATVTNRSAKPEPFSTVTVAFRGHAEGGESGSRPSADATWERLGDGPEYEIRVRVNISGSVPYGMYDGELRFLGSELGDGAPVLVIPTHVEVVRDLHVSPEEVYFGIVKAGETVRRELDLTSRSGKAVELVDWRPKPSATADPPVDEDPVPQVNVIQNEGEKAVAELVLSVPKDFPRKGLLKGRVELVSKQGESLGVDWLCAVKG